MNPESEQSYAEIIAELGVKIDTEISRSTSADTVHEKAIQDEVITRQQNVSDLTDLISSNTSDITQNRSDIGDLTTVLSNEITNRQNADAAISGAVDTVLANYLTISAFTEAEENILDTLNDINDRKLDASAYTPTDLSNYYTKSEVYNKTEVNDLNNRKLDASAYTPTDLSNYYTKSEVYNKTEVDNSIAAIDVSEQLAGYLKVSAFTQAEQTINDNIKAVSGSIDTKLDKSDFNSYSADTYATIVSNEIKSGNGITAIKTNSGTTLQIDAEALQITYIDAGEY